MATYYFEGDKFVGYSKPPETESQGDPIPPKTESQGDPIFNYPSVTAIVGLLDKSAALMHWAQRVTIEYIIDNWSKCKNLEGHALTNFFDTAIKEALRKRDDAGSYGTDLHKILEQVVKGEQILSEARDDTEFYFAIEKFLGSNKNFLSEKHVVSRTYGFAGCVDLYDPDNKILIDLKTGKDVYNSNYLQLAGYLIALEEMGYPVEKSIILHWDKQELSLNEINCTDKVLKMRTAFLNLVDFYYSFRNRRVVNNRTI